MKGGFDQKHPPESWEAITRFASFTDADTLTNRQLKLSDPGMHSMHASSFSHNSVRDLEAPGPTKLIMELMKLFNWRSARRQVRSGLQVPSRSIRDSGSVETRT
jgi:hypothetical protein